MNNRSVYVYSLREIVADRRYRNGSVTTFEFLRNEFADDRGEGRGGGRKQKSLTAMFLHEAFSTVKNIPPRYRRLCVTGTEKLITIIEKPFSSTR